MHTIESLMSAWRAVDHKLVGSEKGIRPSQTKDPILLAGLYLDWASGSLERAIAQVEVHCSKRYLDCPSFPGCHETLILLRSLQ